MWNELKEAPLVWRLLALVGIPIVAIFACGTVGLLGYLVIDRSPNQTQSVNQEIVADAPPPTILPTSEAISILPVATATPPVATPTPTPAEISYELNWKIEEGQPIAYNTAMETSNCCTSIDYNQIFNFGQSDEGTDAASHFEKMFEDLKNNQPTYSLISILEKKPEGNIFIKMVLDNVEIPKQESDDLIGQGFGQMLKGMEGSVQLQGEITPEGEIDSPYIPQQQRNLLALFFELPVGPVKVGDTWQIDLTCITLNSAQFTIGNSNRVNQVTLKKIIETPKGESIAVLDYLIAESVEGEQTTPFFANEPVPTTMKCGFVGRGEFLIEQGRWRAFSVENTIQSTGVITSDITQQFALSPLDQVPEYSEKNNIQDVPKTQVVVALKPISLGTEFTDELVGYRDWPVNNMPPDTIFDKTEAIGRISKFDIVEGQLIIRRMFAN
jgi:hypothetical protein